MVRFLYKLCINILYTVAEALEHITKIIIIYNEKSYLKLNWSYYNNCASITMIYLYDKKINQL